MPIDWFLCSHKIKKKVLIWTEAVQAGLSLQLFFVLINQSLLQERVVWDVKNFSCLLCTALLRIFVLRVESIHINASVLLIIVFLLCFCSLLHWRSCCVGNFSSVLKLIVAACLYLCLSLSVCLEEEDDKSDKFSFCLWERNGLQKFFFKFLLKWDSDTLFFLLFHNV